MSNPDAASKTTTGLGPSRTTWTIAAVSVDHYENFPVASWLCPPTLRPAVAAIYHFARTADDLADEGEATPDQRLADLAAYRIDLSAMLRGNAVSARWPRVFGALAPVIERHALPVTLLTDLLSAFEQDVVKLTYTDRAELLDYCRRSANPVGRLLLHLYGVGGAESLRQSDAICTALQLANFWQDMSVDTRRGRLYTPTTDLARHGVEANALLLGADTPNVRRLIAELVEWARTLMLSGAPLVHAISGRAGWELRLVVQGGLRILDKIAALDFATLQTRPTLGALDTSVLVLRALRMRAPANRAVNRSA
jgi:hydroxysqualene synthase